jgi:transcriptional regulator with GAF, ATPase, and Fis domain
MFADATSASSQEDGSDGHTIGTGGNELQGLRKLQGFSEKLMHKGSIDELLDTMLDDIIELTGADKGVILLTEPEESGQEKKIEVRAVRNVSRESITDGRGGVSDSIARTVLKTAKPIIVSDALADTTFGKSESVVALQLSSVMCAPMLSQGEVIGALYVGNDKVKHLFERPQLDMLTIYGAQASLILQNAMLLSALRADKEKLAQELSDKRFGEIIGSCPSMMEVFRKLQKVATTDISVLITGETGTGKELIARELHRRSPRASGPFVTINCGAIPENLIESELFGHVRGAFTGAVANRSGKFQAADGGTLFLDEIGELPLNLQVKLLRALQERVVIRVGDSRPEKVDIRVVAATNKILEEEIKRGSFREDLYYRLNVVNLWLPPLRERGEDVAIIAKALLSKYADEMKSPVRGLSPPALAAIRKFPWPGNIRQLENRLKKALVLCDRTLLSAEDLDLGPEAQQPILPLEKAKEEFQRSYVLQVLERNNGNRTQTARELGVDPRTIFRYLEKEPHPMPSESAGTPRDSSGSR